MERRLLFETIQAIKRYKLWRDYQTCKKFVFPGPIWQSSKIFGFWWLAPVNKATLDSLKKLHPTQGKPFVVQSFSSQAHKFSEEIVSEQLHSFSRFTAAGPSKMFPEHLLHAVQCITSDQSIIALRVLTKLVNICCRGEFPEFDSQVLCSASLSALLKKKGGIRPIAVGEVLRRLIAKGLAKSEAILEANELFQSLQLGFGVKGGAEPIIYSTKLSYEKILTSSSSSGILQIDFCNAFYSIKCSEMLKAVASSIVGIAVFTNFCYSQHSQLFFDKFVDIVKAVSNKATQCALCFSLWRSGPI